jgi:hypothetical protein
MSPLDEVVDPVAMGVTYLCVGGGGALTARSAPTYPTGTYFNENSERENETALWRAARVEGHSIALFDVDPGTPGGKTTLKLSTREFMTPALNEVDGITLERPAKAILAGTIGPVARPTISPKPKPVVRGTKEELPATGLGGGLLGGAAAIGAAALLARKLGEPDSI